LDRCQWLYLGAVRRVPEGAVAWGLLSIGCRAKRRWLPRFSAGGSCPHFFILPVVVPWGMHSPDNVITIGPPLHWN